ncbi:hypothetical protein [Paenibacillus ferrarius]|uniref:hypothetical protein n=1 Tax=Paenibacillus ferrarius TaxID=1469647 RepID=UPI001301A9EA|nr:hypothetical protein [Paenibacillus ferrarius]
MQLVHDLPSIEIPQISFTELALTNNRCLPETEIAHGQISLFRVTAPAGTYSY